MKNLRLIRILFLLFVIGLLIVLFQFIRLPFLPVRLHEAVPSSTAVMLQYQSSAAVERITETDGNILLSTPTRENLRLLNAVFPEEGKGEILSALRAADLEILSVTRKSKGFKLQRAINELAPDRVREITFEDHRIFEIAVGEAEKLIITQFRNLLIFARRAYLVEESVVQLNDYAGSVRSEKYFRRAERTETAGAEVYVYVNFKNVGTRFSTFLGLKKSADIDHFGKWVNWLKLGLVPTDNGYRLGGAVTGDISVLRHLNDYRDDNLYKVLPENLSVLTQMQAPLIGYFSADFQKYFQPWISGEVAYANLEPVAAGQISEKFLIVKATDTDLAEKMLADLGQKTGRLEHFDYQMYHIEQLMADDVLMPVFGERLNPIKNPYYTTAEDYVIFSNSKQALQIWLDKIIAGKTLSKDVLFLQTQTEIPEGQKVAFSLNFTRLTLLLQNYLQPAYREEFARVTERYTGFGPLTLGIYPQGQRLLLSGSLHRIPRENTPQGKENKRSEAASASAEIVWKAALQNPPVGTPVVVNQPDGRPIIFISDENNILYCFSAAGEKRWQRKFNRPILSDLYVLSDRDGTPSVLLFNTEKEVHKVSLTGTDTLGFPLRLPSKTLTGLTAVDFDRNGSFAFFIPCKNKNIYGYAADGTTLPGWNPQAKVGRFETPLRHFQSADKDFIFGIDTDGRMHVFQRDGRLRFAPSVKLRDDYITQAESDDNPAAVRIVAVNEEGRLIVTNTEGESFSLNLKLAEKAQPSFLFKDIVGDERKDYILLNDKDLAVWNYVGKEFKQTGGYTFASAPEALFDPGAGIGILRRPEAEILLFDTGREPHPDFPLGGTTAFKVTDWDRDGRREVVTGCKEGLCVYRLRD